MDLKLHRMMLGKSSFQTIADFFDFLLGHMIKNAVKYQNIGLSLRLYIIVPVDV